MNRWDYVQNFTLLLFVVAVTFGVWYLSGSWGGAWAALLLLFWTS